MNSREASAMDGGRRDTPAEQRDDGPRLRGRLLFLAKVALAIALVAWLTTGRLDLGRLAAMPLSFDLALLVAMLFAAMFLPAVRWWWLLRAQDLEVSFWRAARLTWVGYATAVFLPGAASGDLARACLIARDQRAARLRALWTVFIDRVLGLYSLLLLGCLSAVGFLLTAPARGGLGWVCAAMIATLVGVTLAAVLAALGPWRRVVARFAPAWADAWSESHRLYRQSAGALVGCLALSLASSGLTAASLAAADHALGGDVPWTSSLLVGPLVVLANCLPITPGGVGVAEAAASGLFGQVGSAAGAEMMLTLRLVMAALAAPALLALFGHGGRRISSTPQPAPSAAEAGQRARAA